MFILLVECGLMHRDDCINCETCYFCFDRAFVWPSLGRADFHSALLVNLFRVFVRVFVSAYRGEVERLAGWCSENDLELNVSKTKEMVFDFRKKKHLLSHSLSLAR